MISKKISYSYDYSREQILTCFPNHKADGTGKGCKLTPKQKREILQMRRGGATYKEIGEKIGTVVSVIHGFIKQKELKII
jgi:DNA-binding NarL/FixJ family response regulator